MVIYVAVVDPGVTHVDGRSENLSYLGKPHLQTAARERAGCSACSVLAWPWAHGSRVPFDFYFVFELFVQQYRQYRSTCSCTVNTCKKAAIANSVFALGTPIIRV